MRRALDAVLAELKERRKSITMFLAGAEDAEPLIAAVLTGNTEAAAARLAAGDDVDWCVCARAAAMGRMLACSACPRGC